MTLKLLNNIDLHRLAGIKSIIGIDLTEQRARVVELQKQGHVFNRFKTTFRPLRAFTCEFRPASSPAERATLLRQAINENHFVSKYAVTSVQSLGVKTVTATVPSATTNIDEWILEHRENLLKFPVSTGQVVHTYEILDHSESGSLTEITFARSADIQTAQVFFQEVGFTLLSLAAGPRDAFSAFLLGQQGPTTNDATFVHLGNSLLTHATFSTGKRRTTTFTHLDSAQGSDSAINELVNQSSGTPESVIIGGELADTPSPGLNVLKPFGLDSSYTLAVGLALKGFFPELSPTNFLNREQREVSESQFYRSLFQRVVLAGGLTIMVLLLLQLIASFYIQSRIDSADAKLLALGPEYTEVTVLESQVKLLENQLEGRDLSFKRSQMSRRLYDLARLAPPGLWLYRCQQVHQSGQPRILALYGYARTNDLIADYVRNLTAGIAEAELVRAGTPLRSESLLPVGQGSTQFITFQVNVKLRE